MPQPFTQDAPQLGNQYDNDGVLRSWLRRQLPATTLAAMEADFHELGALAGGELYQLQRADHASEPSLTAFSPWGERRDDIAVTASWQAAAPIAARYGLIGTAYAGEHGPWSRAVQFTLAYLFHASTDFYSCPLAMSDGACAALLASGNKALIERAVGHLTSRDPAQAWTSGQWMTESTGGSDVSHTETIARQDSNGQWRLYGRKWFTSAITSQMALALARPEGNGGGSDALAMFYVETRDANGAPNQLEILRLKDKLGTRKLPTAELLLNGTPAALVTGTRGGVRAITPMLNITRSWNSICALAAMRRGIAIARDYAGRRRAFGTLIKDQPLHADTLAGMQAEFSAAFHLVFHVVQLLGHEEAGELDSAGKDLLRLLTPLCKLWTGRLAVEITTEAAECLGGAGYIEDTGLPTLLRDSHVFPIWEGTTNILSLDALRAIQRGDGLPALGRMLQGIENSIDDPSLKQCATQAVEAWYGATRWLDDSVQQAGDEVEAGARRFALTLARATALGLLTDHARWAGSDDPSNSTAAARRFCSHGISQISSTLAQDSAPLAAG